MYVSPFNSIEVEHEFPDSLCTSRAHCADPGLETLTEYYLAACSLIERDLPLPAFFTVRHLAELSLKTLHKGSPPRVHSLEKLLTSLHRQGDPLCGAGWNEELVRRFLVDLHQRDPGGDQGRYATTTGDSLSLADVCCARASVLLEHTDRLFAYVQKRLAP